MELDATFLFGSAAFISAVIIFIGSIWLLLALIMGARLAYWVTASVTLSFMLMMAAVWSYGDPLGPVGTLPHWVDGQATEGTQAPEGAPGGYPDSGPWRAPDAQDETEMGHVSELESAAQEVFQREVDEETIQPFGSEGQQAIVDTEQTRLADQGGEEYGAVTFMAAEPEDTDGPAQSAQFTPVTVVMRFDPGYPNRPAHLLLVVTLILFIGHLIGLGRVERRAREARERAAATTA